MNHLTLYYRSETYLVHYCDTTVVYLRTADGTIIDYDEIPPDLLNHVENAIRYNERP